MFTPVSVSLSGGAFSYLLYESKKCSFQQEGFLLGEIIHKETRTITDNDQQQLNITKTIRINSTCPCPQNHFFYDGTGKIDGDKIRHFLGNQFTKVVAWYKFQRAGTNLKLTMRDKVIHKQLTELFGISSQIFTCSLIGSEKSEKLSTYSFSQDFIRCYSLSYEKLPVHVPNLSESNHTYKSSEPASQTFNKLIVELKIDRKNTQGLIVIHKIRKSVENHTDSVLKELSQIEKEMFELEEGNEQLRITNDKKKNKKIKMENKIKGVIQNNETVTKENKKLKNNEDILEDVKQKNEDESKGVMDISFDEIPLSNQLTKKHETELETTCPPKEDSPEIHIKTVNSPRRRGRGRGRAKEVKDVR